MIRACELMTPRDRKIHELGPPTVAGTAAAAYPSPLPPPPPVSPEIPVVIFQKYPARGCRP